MSSSLLRRFSLQLLPVALSVPALWARQAVEARPDAVVQEEAEDYYSRWLKQDVVYIITDEERAIFQSLTTPEEKEQFIEQFWFRRDPDPRTAENEFKEEHYRRIAYANEHFASGIKGWQTDRGKIYIIHGPPDEITSRPSGGPYHRPIVEGGGTTVTFPFEVWRYRNLPGLGSDIVIEFVDRTQSGEYRIALTPEEKDVLLRVPGYGLTLSEELGMTRKEDRLIFSPWKRFEYRGPFNYYQDPFEQYERYVAIRQPQPVRYKDLQELVQVNVSYDSLPFRVRQDFLKLNDAQVLVPITVEISNRELTFREEMGVSTSKVAIYGIVTSISNRIVQEFDADLATSFPPDQLAAGLTGKSIYQKVLMLDRKGRYKFTLVVKDTVSGKVGTTTDAIIPPNLDADRLRASTLILADKLQQLEKVPERDEMFVLGDFYVRPSLDPTFPSDRPVNAYYQLYNVGLDQTSQAPSLSIRYRILKDGETVLEFPDTVGRSVQYFTAQRVVVAAGFPLTKLAPGRYQLSVEVTDNIRGQTLELHDQFQVVGTSG